MATVKDILERKGKRVATIGPEAMALQAACQMNELRIGSLVVVAGGRVVGMVTERDMMDRVVAEARDPATTPVSAIMSGDVASCTPATKVEECRDMMSSRRIRRLPVIVEGELLGIVTIGDILRQEIEDHQSTIGHLREYLESPPTPFGQQSARAGESAIDGPAAAR